jgi:hypothetical protein
MLACPSWSWITFNSLPAASARLAAPRRAVPQIVPADRRHPAVFDRLHELAVEMVGVERLAATVGEDEPARMETQPRGFPLLASFVAPQLLDRGAIQHHHPPARAGLGRAVDQPPVDALDGVGDH